MQHLLSGCKKLAGTEYLRRHDNTLKALAVKWEVKVDYYQKILNGIEKNGKEGKYWKIMERNYIGTGNIGCGIAAQQEGQI